MKQYDRFGLLLNSPVALWSLIFAAGLVWRIWLDCQYPAWSGWDGFERLCVSDSSLFVRHWLPLPQLFVALVAMAGGSVEIVRWLFAVMGSAAAVTFGLAASRLTQRQGVGLIAGVLMAFLPGWVRYSMAPYQEAPFFLFFTMAIWAWAKGFENERPSVSWLGGVCLALASLCRYEAWIAALIIGCGAVIRKQFKGLAYLSLTAVVAAAWLATFSTRVSSYGPLGARQPSAVDALAEPLSATCRAACIASGQLIAYLSDSWTLVGVLLVAGGILLAARQKGVFGREMIVILAMFLGVALARASLSGITTDRMGLLAAAFGVLYLSIGLIALRDRWGRIPSHAITCIVLSVFVAQGYSAASQLGPMWAPEANAAQQLLAVEDGVDVQIEPRQVPNPFGESAVVAIFGHTFDLDHQDPRWIYRTRNGWSSSRKAERILFWKDGRYELATASSYEAQLADRPRQPLGSASSSRDVAGKQANTIDIAKGDRRRER